MKSCNLPQGTRATGWTCAGLFMVTLSTLMFEILLTRIFSVTMWYHFAFVAISLAMFGMTVGALIVYLLPAFFAAERVKHHLALSALLFSLCSVVSFLAHLRIPFILYGDKLVGLPYVVLTYLVVSLPFVFSGIAVCLALTRFPGQIGRLYGFDLAGAALGCIVLIYTLEVTDGPTAVLVVAALTALGSLLFAAEAGCGRLKWVAAAVAALFLTGSVWHTVLVHRQRPLIRLSRIKGRRDPPPLYEKWNSFSRLDVTGDPDELHTPFGWGLSAVCPPELKARELQMRIDGEAGTVLTAFDGDLRNVEHLKYDVTSLVHWVRRDGDVLVVGSGGGRDVLAALAFGQKSVRAVEMNGDIIRAVTGRFGDYTGHLDRNPKVRFVNDEARSYIARLKEKFDILQVSLIDTWAATAAGAYVLTESLLYTVEAWDTFLDRLKPQGVLTFSRWYYRDRPGEMYRLVSLASASLARRGVANPRDHILVAGRRNWEHFGNVQPGRDEDAPEGVGTILVSPDRFSPRDVERFEEVCMRLKFDVVLTPRVAADDTFARLASGKDLQAFTRTLPINITPPTDDSPFFFHMLWLRDIFNKDARYQGQMTFNMKAVAVLGLLLAAVVILTLLCIVLPLLLTTRRGVLKGSLPLFFYFSGIGMGFMLIEISQMQRLNVFLGHPVYGLSVVLFALLLSSSAGSALTQKIRNGGGTATACLLLLLGALALFGWLTPGAIRWFHASVTGLRIAVAVGVLFPLGLFMGMAFPLGMRFASGRSPALTPWLFGINGATSVCASVLAVVIALTTSISATFWTGLACYGAAFAAYQWARRRNEAP